MLASNFRQTVEAPKERKSLSLDSSPITIYDFQFTIFNCKSAMVYQDTSCGDVAAPAVLLRTTKQRGWNYFIALIRSIRLATSVR